MALYLGFHNRDVIHGVATTGAVVTQAKDNVAGQRLSFYVVAGGREFRAEHFISSLPIRDLIHMLDPAPPENVLRAADDFHYRDFLTVALILRGTNLFPDNWIYVHAPEAHVGRTQNFKNWSADMVPDEPGIWLYHCHISDHMLAGMVARYEVKDH